VLLRHVIVIVHATNHVWLWRLVTNPCHSPRLPYATGSPTEPTDTDKYSARLTTSAGGARQIGRKAQPEGQLADWDASREVEVGDQHQRPSGQVRWYFPTITSISTARAGGDRIRAAATTTTTTTTTTVRNPSCHPRLLTSPGSGTKTG